MNIYTSSDSNVHSTDFESKARILNQEEIGEQSRAYIAPFTKQPVDLTWLI